MADRLQIIPTSQRKARLADLLGALGNSVIDVAQFWKLMAEAGFDDADIDQYCAEEGRWTPDEART
jgi:hypothetical protein